VPPNRRYDKETLEAWKVITLGAIAALAIASGLLAPILQSSHWYDSLRWDAGLAFSLLASAWCVLDSRIERYDIDQDSPPIGALFLCLPILGVLYYFVRIRGLRASAPLAGRALLFTFLTIALFVVAKQFSADVLANP